MNRVDQGTVRWLKSSHSNGEGNCVEVAFLGDTVAVRDSKHRGAGPVLTSTVGEWAAFIAGVAAGEFGEV
ncbi:DUF397 domain-containing protein [Streptomyces sp. B8F3]|uniref:DUF397 domain-containing protein n=1 Tax=unclassified Streptomyces TaxID=2593676 RepID=UPI00325C5BA8